MPLHLTDEPIRQAPLLTLAHQGDENHTQEFAASRGTKMHLTLGEYSPGEDALSASITSGNSYQYKRLMQERDQVEKVQTQNDIMASVLQADPTAITPEVVSVVHSLSTQEMKSPDLGTIVEEKYAKLYTNMAASSLENDILEESMQADSEKTYQLLDRAEAVAFKKNYAETVLDRIRQTRADQSILSKTGDFVEKLVPFSDWYQKHNAIPGADNFVTSVLPGANLEEQYAYMWGLSDPKEFKDTLDAVMVDLESRNLITAETWMQGLFSFGESDANMESVWAGVDVASFVPVNTLRKALVGILRGAAKNPKNIAEIATDLGKNADAGIAKSVDDIKNGDFLGNNIKNAQELENSIPSLTSPSKMLEGSQNVPQAAYLRLKEAVLARADLAKKFLAEPNLIDRAAPEELVKYKDELLADYVRDHPSIQKSVIDVEMMPKTDIGNVYNAKIVIGQRSGELFESEKQAAGFAKRYLGIEDFNIVQKGEGFQIEILRAVDETRFDKMKLLTTQQSPESFANTFGGWWLRSPNYLVSREAELARSTAVTSTEAMTDVFSKLTEPFRKLTKQHEIELQELMITNRQKQQYYENYGEFEKAFFERNHKNPTPEQADAYFAYVQINDLDLVVRDLDWYKQKARMGLEEITVKMADSEASFEGKIIDTLPYGSADRFSVSIVKDGVAKKPVSNRFITEKLREEINKLVQSGYKIVHVADQSFKVGDSYAGFLVTKDLKRSRVGVKNVDRKAGGHKVHKYPYYIKQGMMNLDGDRSIYRGDRTLFNVRSEKEGAELVKVLEEARQKLVRRDPDAIKFIRDNLPIPVKQFMAAVQKGQIDLSVPFTLTRKGSRTVDTGALSSFKNLDDVTKNEHNLTSRMVGRYGGERDAHDLSIIQSEGNNLFEVETAPYLAPLETLRLSSNNMLSTRVMNDYSIMTSQNYLREFGDILEGTAEEQKAGAIALLMNPKFKSTVSPARKAAAENVASAYRNLMNHGTELDRKIESYKENILASIQPKLGPRGQQWVEDRMLGATLDPSKYFRTAAYHLKLGMFNVQQYFIQANSLVNVASVAGRDGLRGGLVYPIFRSALLSSEPAVLQRAAKVAESVGLMKADEFSESMRLYKKSGFNSIGGDQAFLDDIKSPEMRRSPVGAAVKKTLDLGTTPFKEGERLVRIAAWNAAYLEVKKTLKGAITRRDEARILQRAKDLTGNMTRESNATWQKGYAAVITQFMGYQARIMEQFIGKKLTGAEKLRLFTGYSAVYGVPTAMGAMTGVIPVREIANEALLQMGVDPNDEAWEPVLDGFASSMLEFIGGTEFNVASRYGPGGLPTFYDLYRGDKTFSELLIGASGGIVGDTVADSIAFMKGAMSEFSDFPGGYHNLTPDDILSPFRNISTVNNLTNLWNVYNLGVWASKNGTDLTKMNLPEGVMAALTGLQPAAIEDSFAKFRAIKDFKEHIKSVQKELVSEYRKAMKLEDGKTRDKIVREIKARMLIEGFTPREQADTWRFAFDHEMVTDSAFEQYEKLRQRMEAADKNMENQ